jgi:TRAP-type mannitol/chloroaromatic compound transport system permease small subunit
MPSFLITYVRWVEAFNRTIGRFAMYLLFVLMGVLLWGSIARVAWVPQIWTDEMAQFLMVGYFMLGGAWALQQGSAVRMDLLYSTWSPRTKALVDCVTILALLFYLGVLLWGGIESTQYALEYSERRRGLWRPYMAPVKMVMVLGIVMMLLQCTVFLIRDIAKLRGRDI